MLIESLRLKGFRGIRDGLGRDEITLDLTTISSEAKLVALTGPNGRGKTTLMDNLHPYPVMPSRAGQDGLGRFSYYEHLCLPESEKELIWLHAGRRFRSHLVFRINGTKKKTEAFLLAWADGRWQSVAIADGTVSDGKMDTYARCVTDILGAPEAFFTSVFCAQGRQPLSSYTSAAIKSLLAELLGHAAILKQAAAANEVAKLLKAGLVAVRSALADMEAQSLEVRQAATDLPGARHAEASSRTARQAAQQALLDARERLATVNAQLEADKGNATRREEIRARLKGADQDWGAAMSSLKAQTQAEEGRRQALNRRRIDRIARAKADRAALDRRIANLQSVLAQAPAILHAAHRLDVAHRVLDTRIGLETACRTQATRMREIAAAITAKRSQIGGIEREAGQATLKAEDLARRHGLTGEVPCVGTEMQGNCKLLGEANQAKSLMPSAQRDIQRLGQDRSKADEELVALQAEQRELADAAKAFDAAERRRANAAERLQRFERLASRAAEIERAGRELTQTQRERNALGSVDERPTAEEAEEAQAIEEALNRIAAAQATAHEKRSRETDALTGQLDALPAPFDVALVQAASKAVAEANQKAELADRVLTSALQRLQTLTDTANKGAALEARLALARENVVRIESKVTVWSLLARALGNDGIVALSIDDAGPTLSALANELLLRCYGPQFTVSLRTQVATAKGEAREGFSILVHDAESGQSKELDFMSGGQRLWINECLTRAIALYLTQSSGRRYETLFSDESDGPLDPERKRMFMAMKRAVLEIGGYKREFFISQTPELTAMADARIDLGEMAISAGMVSDGAFVDGTAVSRWE